MIIEPGRETAGTIRPCRCGMPRDRSPCEASYRAASRAADNAGWHQRGVEKSAGDQVLADHRLRRTRASAARIFVAAVGRFCLNQ
jgi:hypothetical protein